MFVQHSGLTAYLQSIWLRAYDGEVFVSDLTGEPSGMLRSMEFYNALQNYRRKVRTKKLNPVYAPEWARIDRCVLKRISNTVFYLARRDNVSYQDKIVRRDRYYNSRFKDFKLITYL